MDAATLIFDPSTGTGATFDAIFAEALEAEAEVYDLDPTGGQPSRY